MRIAEKVEIAPRMDAKQRLDAAVLRRLGRPNGAEDRIDPPLVLGRRMQAAVEKFGRRRMAPLPLVPEAPHRRALAASGDKS
jgi:hypothetical protein